MDDLPPTIVDPTRFIAAVRAGRVDRVRTALEIDPDLARARIEEPGPEGPRRTTALHLAVLTGDLELVRILLAAGAGPDVVDGEGRTPLHHAIEDSQAPIQQLLLVTGARPDTAAAAALDRVELLAALLDADPARVDERSTGISPLAWAAYCDATAAARLLLERGARNDDRELECAAACGHAAVARVLLEGGADPDERCPRTGRTALHVAAELRFTREAVEFVGVLRDAGADATLRDHEGDRPVDVALRLAARQRDEGPFGFERDYLGMARALAV